MSQITDPDFSSIGRTDSNIVDQKSIFLRSIQPFIESSINTPNISEIAVHYYRQSLLTNDN